MKNKINIAILFIFLALIFWKGNKIMENLSIKEFKKKFLDAYDKAQTKGIPANILLALASYESGNGNNTLAKLANNIFSITKSSTWTGKTIKLSTGYTFKVYNSWTESINDFVNLISNPKYTNYYSAYKAALSGDIYNFAKYLQAGGYGDPGKTTYASELIARSNSLTKIA